MNCRPGDLAIVVRDRHNLGYFGRLVEVLYAAPTDRLFKLPNGVLHEPCPAGDWIVHILGSPMLAPFGGRLVPVVYGCGADVALRPLRGDPVPEKVEDQITA